MKIGTEWGKRERKFVTEPVCEDEPSKCSFCGRNASDFYFNAYSLDGKACMCCECLEKMVIISRLGKIRKIYGNGKAWEEVSEAISKEVRAEPSTNVMRKVASAFCFGLARRACSILCGFREVGHKNDPHTKVDLAPPRVAMVGSMSREMGALLSRGCDVVGIPVVQVTVSECRSGVIHTLIKWATMRDSLVKEHALVFVKDGFVPLDIPNPVVYAISEASGLPDGIRRLPLDEEAG